jgi:hypothetical protein
MFVEHLEPAMDELSRALGVHWGEPLEQQVDGWQVRATFTQEGPPYLSLLEIPHDGPWDATNLPRIDHVGCWADAIGQDKRSLDANGMLLELDGAAHGGTWSIHRGATSGLRIELVDPSRRAAFEERWVAKPTTKRATDQAIQ